MLHFHGRMFMEKILLRVLVRNLVLYRRTKERLLCKRKRDFLQKCRITQDYVLGRMGGSGAGTVIEDVRAQESAISMKKARKSRRRGFMAGTDKIAREWRRIIFFMRRCP